jgi:hypothetical protein
MLRAEQYLVLLSRVGVANGLFDPRASAPPDATQKALCAGEQVGLLTGPPGTRGQGAELMLDTVNPNSLTGWFLKRVLQAAERFFPQLILSWFANVDFYFNSAS